MSIHVHLRVHVHVYSCTVVCLQFSFTVNAFLVYSFRLQFTPPVRTAPKNAITTWRPLHT